MRKAFILYIILTISMLGFGQSPFRLSFHHLTLEGGLSNNNVFFIYTDSRNFTWLGSLNGLSRFDGVNVKVYKPYNSKIKSSKITNIKEDKNGDLWIGSTEGLSHYQRKKDEFEFIEGPNKEKKYYTHPVRFDEKGLLWLTVYDIKQNGLYTYDSKSKKFTFITNQTLDHFSINQGADYQKIKTLISTGKDYLGLRKLTFENNKLVSAEPIFDGKNGFPALKNMTDYVCIDNDSIAWITGGSPILYKYNFLKNTIKTFKVDEPHTLNQASIYQNYVFIGSGKGVVIFDKKSEKFIQYLTHSKLNTHGLASDWNEVAYIDKNGNLFLSQLGIGIDYTNIKRYIAEHWVKPEDAAQFGYSSNSVTNIINNGDLTFFEVQGGGTFLLDKNGKIIEHLKGLKPLFTDSDSRTWLTDFKGAFISYNPFKQKKEKLFFKELANNIGWLASGVEIERGHYLFAGNFGLYEYIESNKSLKPIEIVNQKKFLNIAPIIYDKKSKKIFCSTNWWSEQYVLEKVSNQWKLQKFLQPISSVYGIRQSVNPDYVWFCSNMGLMHVNTKTLKSTLKTEKEGLPDNFATDIFEESNGNYWLVTNKGISYFDKSKNTYKQFTSKDGAYSNEYAWSRCFKLSDGRIVFGGKNGISVFGQDALKTRAIKPSVQITQINVNEKPFKTAIYIGETQEIELAASENTFSFDLVGIEYGFPERVRLQYQLKGFDNQWIKTKNPTTARYVNVPEGTYTLAVKATDEDEKVSSEIRNITIIVHAPFYRTAWFRSLLVASLILLGYLFYRLRIKQIQEKAKKKEEIRRIKAEAEINALRSQMNPHFIFNCLNTVDSYILRNKTDEASEFLNKFSKLIRMILENSRQEFVPLIQDLKALELYIKLEQERSFPQFQYEINIDQNLNENEFFVPSMLIQPFVENAILHGLRHKKDEIGELFLNLKVTDNQLIIFVIDNGIGREASQKINSLKNILKQSVGVKLSEERIAKLNEIYAPQSYLKITDIDENNDKGTIVEIGLPLITHQDLSR
jgi:ligand-binding sensor domain-containing protein